MRIRRSLTRVSILACLATGAAGAVPALASAENAVFVQNDRPAGNQVIAYDRAGDGTLTQAGVYATGGAGGQLEGSVFDHTASQGALAYDRADGLLLAANAGSNTISVFAVFGDRLALRQVIASGGSFPASIAAGPGYVYVLNALEGGSVQGYAIIGGRLAALPGAHRALGLPQVSGAEQFTHTPAQVGFTPDGSSLIVTTKAAGQSIDVLRIRPGGGLAAPVVNEEPGTVPFGFTFDRHGNLVVSEAGPSALASFQLAGDGHVLQLDQVATGQAATCWVVAAAGRFFTSNTGSASLSGFQSSIGGQLLTLLGQTPTHPGPVDSASAGRFLYVQGGGEGTVDEFEVQHDGSLGNIGSVTVPGAVGGEGIAAG
jgi:6-phosphogluconolactonase (cycloisomerase 2 family)